MNARVFVVQEPPKRRGSANEEWEYKYDISKAGRFGDVRIVLNWNEAKNLQPYHMLKALHKRLDGFNNQDFLLMIGSPAVMVLSALVAASKRDVTRLQLLLHDRSTDDYEQVTIHCEDIEQENDDGTQRD